MKKKALFSALTSKLKNGELRVVSGLEKIEPKTKEMAKIIKNLKIEQNTTIVLPKVLENIIRAGRNLKKLGLIQAKQLNTYKVLNSGYLIFIPESIKVLKETHGIK